MLVDECSYKIASTGQGILYILFVAIPAHDFMLRMYSVVWK